MATKTIEAGGAAAPRQGRRDGLNWLFLLPAVAFFLAYQLYPLARVFWLSFTDYRYLRQEPARFVGLENYINALGDPLVWIGLGRALLFTVVFLPGIVFLPMLLAILIDRVQSPRLATLYRLVLLIPAVIPGPMVFVLWKWLYNFQIGPINVLLVEAGLFTPQTAPQWLGGTSLTIPAVALMEIWWGLGYHTMFFLAGLAAVPKELWEAARIDGANEWQLFWRVTLPRLRPVLAILVVLRFGSAMALIDEYLIFGGFTRSSPTYTWTIYMYELAFRIGDWLQGYAAAVGWIGALAMIIVVGGLLRVFRPTD